MEWANSAAVVPSASSRCDPSGSRTEMTPAIVQPFLVAQGIVPPGRVPTRVLDRYDSGPRWSATTARSSAGLTYGPMPVTLRRGRGTAESDHRLLGVAMVLFLRAQIEVNGALNWIKVTYSPSEGLDSRRK